MRAHSMFITSGNCSYIKVALFKREKYSLLSSEAPQELNRGISGTLPCAHILTAMISQITQINEQNVTLIQAALHGASYMEKPVKLIMH